MPLIRVERETFFAGMLATNVWCPESGAAVWAGEVVDGHVLLTEPGAAYPVFVVHLRATSAVTAAVRS